MAYRTRNITVRACPFMAHTSFYNEELIRSLSMKHTDRYDLYGSYEPQHTLPCCYNEMHAPYVLRIRTVSNADGLMDRWIRQLLLTVPKSAAVLNMEGHITTARETHIISFLFSLCRAQSYSLLCQQPPCLSNVHFCEQPRFVYHLF